MEQILDQIVAQDTHPRGVAVDSLELVAGPEVGSLLRFEGAFAEMSGPRGFLPQGRIISAGHPDAIELATAA